MMCSRYAIYAPADDLADFLPVDTTPAYTAQYNAAPTHLLPVITAENSRGLSFFYWGVTPETANNKAVSKKLYNYDVSKKKNQRSFTKDLMHFRCLIPANNYYAWKTVGKKTHIPYRVYLKDESIFGFAGFWSEYEDDQNQSIYTFSIAVVSATSAMESFDVHQPVILQQENARRWLFESSGDVLMDLLTTENQPILSTHPVSVRVNDVKNNDPELIRRTAPANQLGNYTLFD